jgi:FlaA1/EpsC-like NDP-sugar epimerase
MSGLRNPYLHGKVVLVTGGTGSFGTAFVKALLAEHVHEVFVTEDESRSARELADRYVIYPPLPSWALSSEPLGEELRPGFRYSSDTNDHWLDVDAIRSMAEPIVALV